MPELKSQWTQRSKNLEIQHAETGPGRGTRKRGSRCVWQQVAQPIQILLFHDHDGMGSSDASGKCWQVESKLRMSSAHNRKAYGAHSLTHRLIHIGPRRKASR